MPRERSSSRRACGLRIRLDELSPDTHVVVIWNATHLTEDEKRHAQALCDFAGRGGRVIVLSTPSWDWPELCDVKISHEPTVLSGVSAHGPQDLSA